MHYDKDLNKKDRKENQKTDDDDNIFLTLANLDSPELRKFLMFGIGLALVLIVLDWWQPILVLGIFLAIMGALELVRDYLKQRFSEWFSDEDEDGERK